MLQTVHLSIGNFLVDGVITVVEDGLLIQPTEQQIHLPVVFTARVGFTPPAPAAPAFMDGLSWHAS